MDVLTYHDTGKHGSPRTMAIGVIGGAILGMVAGGTIGAFIGWSLGDYEALTARTVAESPNSLMSHYLWWPSVRGVEAAGIVARMDAREIQDIIDRLQALKQRHADLIDEQIALTNRIIESAAQNEQAREYLEQEVAQNTRDQESRRLSRRAK